MCRISIISEDWVVKGCHLHVGPVELALRPDHRGGIVCRRCFATTPAWQIEAASKEVVKALEDPTWRAKLQKTLERATVFLQGIEGEPMKLARGRLRELRFLVVALERWESS
jgi:hypothetical protein